MKDNIEQEVVMLLREKALVMTTAESCTGGLVAAGIVNVPGASAVFKEGYITYSNEAKQKLLGVSAQTLAQHTAVSRETAAEMAAGGAYSAAADVCVAVTGVAGPDTEDGNPVGLVYVGCYCEGEVQVMEYHFKGTRREIRELAAEAALQLAAACLKK